MILDLTPGGIFGWLNLQWKHWILVGKMKKGDYMNFRRAQGHGSVVAPREAPSGGVPVIPAINHE